MDERKEKSSLPSLIEIIKGHKSFLIASHIEPDGDTLGCAIGLALALRDGGKTVAVICDDPVPNNLDFLETILSIRRPDDAWEGLPEAPEVAVAVDAGDEKRLGQCYAVLRRCPVLLNIDHHPTNPEYGDCNLVDPAASATAELIYELIKAADLPIGTATATCLYTGVATDTGCFRYANTSPSALRIGAELTELGVNPSAVAEAVYDRKSYNFLKLLGSCLSSMQRNDTGEVAWCQIPKFLMDSYGVDEGQLDGLVSYPRMVVGVEVAIVFREGQSGVKISMRSKGKVDVSLVASELGGGGHRRAAGATVDLSLEAAIEQTLAIVNRSLGC